MAIVTQDELRDRLLRLKFLRETKPQPPVGLSAMSSLTKGGEGAVRPGWYSIAYLFKDHEGQLEVPLFNIRLRNGEYEFVNNLLQGACNDLVYSFIDLSKSVKRKEGCSKHNTKEREECMSARRILSKPVLMLNKSWTAVGVASVESVIGLLFGEYRDGTPKAKIIAAPGGATVIDATQAFQAFTWADWSKIRPSDGEDVIRTSHDQFKIPEVILLTRYDKFPQQRTHFSRRTVHKRDSFTCQYCGCHVANEGTLDHIIPRSQGGLTSWDNCVLACVNCNSQKANRRPEEAYRGKGQSDWHPTKAANGWKGPSPMRLLSKPEKPKMSLFKGERRYYPKSWENFISEAYWTVELANDMEETE